MDLKRSMNLAGQSLLASPCPTRYNLSAFQVRADPANKGKAFLVFHAPCHNLGRWWDAMLRLENATGFAIPLETEALMLGHLHKFFDNPDNLCFIPVEMTDIPPLFYPHSFRENILALAAVHRFRGNRWALEQARKTLETIDRILKPDCSWDFERLHYHQHCVKCLGKEAVDYFEYRGRRGCICDPNVGVDGRLLEGLVWCYEMTGLPLAMELADRVARFHLQHSTHPDGTLNTEIHPEHTHSYLNTMKGLLRFGVLTGQRQYVDAIAATFRVTIKNHVVKESGFASHDFMQDGISEVSSPGDAAQIALWLGLNGYPEFFDDAERLIRARILPSQLTKSPGLVPGDDNPGTDHATLNERFIGGYGCGMWFPNMATHVYTDVTAAVLHTLTDVYHNIAARTDAGLSVYLHFDCEDNDVKVTSVRDREATVTVVPKERENVFIRVPRWTATESVAVTVGGCPAPLRMVGDFAFISRDRLPGEIVLKYALPERTTTERTKDIDFTYNWRGDEIVGVSPNDDFMPYYPSAEGCKALLPPVPSTTIKVKRRDTI